MLYGKDHAPDASRRRNDANVPDLNSSEVIDSELMSNKYSIDSLNYMTSMDHLTTFRNSLKVFE